MSYRVKTDEFEGPFDLLLSLVSEQKVDIAAISVAEIANQYLDTIANMADLDMDVASDFLVVASTLLSLKAAALLPDAPTEELDFEFDDLTPEQTRDILVARLIAYKKYRNAASSLNARMQSESRMHPRHVGPDPEFLGLLPDYLENVTLEGLGVICADLASRHEAFILEAKHIAAKPIAVETYLQKLSRSLEHAGVQTFHDLLDEKATRPVFVVTFLAVLEMYHRGMVRLEQEGGEDLRIELLDRADWAPAADAADRIREPEPVESAPVEDGADVSGEREKGDDDGR